MQSLQKYLDFCRKCVDLALKLWFLLHHFLNFIFDLRKNLSVILCVFWEFFVFGDDFLKEWDFFLACNFFDVLNFGGVFFCYSGLFSFKSHFHLFPCRDFFVSIFELSIKLDLLLLGFSLNGVEFSFHGDCFFLQSKILLLDLDDIGLLLLLFKQLLVLLF